MVNAHVRQMPTQEAQQFCCTRNYTHAGVVRSTQMTLRLSGNQWCVCRASKFLALGSMVAITPRLAKENGADRKQQDLSQSMYDGQLSFAHRFARKPRTELVFWQCLAHSVSLKSKTPGY